MALAPDTSLQVAVRPKGPQRSGTCLSVQEGKELCEALQRTIAASKQMQRICVQAAKAFNDERVVLEEVCENLSMRLLIQPSQPH